MRRKGCPRILFQVAPMFKKARLGPKIAKEIEMRTQI